MPTRDRAALWRLRARAGRVGLDAGAARQRPLRCSVVAGWPLAVASGAGRGRAGDHSRALAQQGGGGGGASPPSKLMFEGRFVY